MQDPVLLDEYEETMFSGDNRTVVHINSQQLRFYEQDLSQKKKKCQHGGVRKRKVRKGFITILGALVTWQILKEEEMHSLLII